MYRSTRGKLNHRNPSPSAEPEDRGQCKLQLLYVEKSHQYSVELSHELSLQVFVGSKGFLEKLCGRDKLGLWENHPQEENVYPKCENTERESR